MSTNEREVTRQMQIILQGAELVINQEELRDKLARSIDSGKPLTIKFGLDPSAPDIHLGHAVVLRKLRQMQQLGHRAVIIIGDFTGRIGDPTGRSKGRKALTDREVMQNAETYKEQVFRILDREKTQVRYNGEWLELLTLEDIIRLASTTTVARMLERDDFQNRYRSGVPIGLHEFFYPLMQAYDSVAIGADIELGGTDQTFNILMGRNLQRENGQESQVALFMPLLEGIDGEEKMSKSLGNHIGVDEDAKVMFKKVMEIPDGLIVRYFELATDILPEELAKVKENLADGCNPRDIKLLLARTITGLYHSPEETQAAERFFIQAFTKKEVPTEVETLLIRDKKSQIPIGLLVGDLVAAGYAASNSELRRLISQGGVQIGGVRVQGSETPVADGDVLRIGKKRFVRIQFPLNFS